MPQHPGTLAILVAPQSPAPKACTPNIGENKITTAASSVVVVAVVVENLRIRCIL